MAQENFHASVQYDDLKGSAAADNHDKNKMSKYLEQQGLINADEMLIGIKMWSGEVHTKTQDNPISVTAIVTTSSGYENVKAAIDSGKPLHVRNIRFEMPLNEFFGLFKRFEICISNDGLIDRCDITNDD